MSKKVIVGVDDSATALEAAYQAASLAVSLTSDLYIISAYGASEKKKFSDGVNKIVIDLAATAEDTASTVAEKLRETYPDLSIEASAAEGRPADALVETADRLSADLIVVGNKRVQGLSRFLGSIAASVAAEAPCDLYIVNTHGE